MRNIKPAWLRLLLLVMLGAPAVIGWPLSQFVKDTSSPEYALAWLLYGAAISVIVVSNLGMREWLRLFGFAAVVTVVTCFTGATIRGICAQLWGGGDSARDIARSVYYLVLGATMLAVIPFAVFSVNCFSASGLMLAASHCGQKTRDAAKHVTLILRMLQHAFEVLTDLLAAWREMHPSILGPRHRRDSKTSVWSRLGTSAEWYKGSVVDWCLALLMHTLAPLPYFCAEIERVAGGPHKDVRTGER